MHSYEIQEICWEMESIKTLDESIQPLFVIIRRAAEALEVAHHGKRPGTMDLLAVRRLEV